MAVLVAGSLGWLWYGASKPLPGEAVADQGREHVAPGTVVNYNSNPPTSGQHYTDWIRKGVYDQPRDDRNLVHSLEHGYVVISYNCEVHTQSVRIAPEALAHEGEEATTSAESNSNATVSGGDWELPECKDLVIKLTEIYKKKGEDRLVVVPRPSLDTRIALTAWNRIDKFNMFDEQRVSKFVDAFRNHGPEKTKE